MPAVHFVWPQHVRQDVDHSSTYGLNLQISWVWPWHISGEFEGLN